MPGDFREKLRARGVSDRTGDDGSRDIRPLRGLFAYLGPHPTETGLAGWRRSADGPLLRLIFPAVRENNREFREK